VIASTAGTQPSEPHSGQPGFARIVLRMVGFS